MAHDKLIVDAETILEQATRPVRQQKKHSLKPIEEFYVILLENGIIPNSKPGRPEIVMTTHLLVAAQKRWSLRYLTSIALGQFLRDQGCSRYREIAANGWRFPRLAEARAAWEKRYGRWSWPASGPIEWE
jgi:hypothetical protein